MSTERKCPHEGGTADCHPSCLIVHGDVFLTEGGTNAPPPEWSSLGDRQEVSGHRQQLAEDRFDQEYAYAAKSHTHLWIVTVAHKATDAALAAFDGDQSKQPLLDADTILMRPSVGCYVCETTYEPRLRLRKCPGEPRRGGRR